MRHKDASTSIVYTHELKKENTVSADLKLTVSGLMALATAHIIAMTIQVMPLYYSWCATTRISLQTMAFGYSVLGGPIALGIIIKFWKKSTKPDVIIKMACAAFIVSLIIFHSIKWLLP